MKEKDKITGQQKVKDQVINPSTMMFTHHFRGMNANQRSPVELCSTSDSS